jgi:hypothetical protein
MVSVAPNTDVLHQYVESDRGNGLGTTNVGEQRKTVSNAIRAFLGEAVNVKFVGSGVSSYHGAPHTTTGIPAAISGTATVIDQKITYWLASVRHPLPPASARFCPLPPPLMVASARSYFHLTML